MFIREIRIPGVASIALAGLLFAPYAARAQEECDEPSATYNFVGDLIIDEASLLPLNDWVPLFEFEITDAPRLLQTISFVITDDPNAADRDYDINLVGIRPSDILEIGFFRDNADVGQTECGIFGPADTLVTGRAGTPVAGVPLVIDAEGNLVFQPGTNIKLSPIPLNYVLDTEDFISNGCYIVAVRTSRLWRNAITMSYIHYNASMVLLDGTFPCDAPPCVEPNPDSYPFCDGEPFEGAAYSSSFLVADITGGPDTDYFDPLFANSWAHPRFLYTPLGEYSRPRFDVVGSAFDFVAGEFLELRRLIPLDNWMPLIGINAHGIPSNTNLPVLKEVNVILTDIGADPLGPAGNGGFNPIQGLETFTNEDKIPAIPADIAFNRDFAFNGLWVFFDTNGNGSFDAPLPTPGGGISMADRDHPMFPEGRNLGEFPDDRNPGLARWEYVPFPPGGGDPWWKIRLRFSNNGRRRNPLEEPIGHLEERPDGSFPVPPTSFHFDYFVAIRPDSGYQDSQILPGDGVGLTYGADFRAFIEPRRFNPNSNHQDGGIFFANQRPNDSFIAEGVYLGPAWQDDPLWGESEPWWPQRTLNQTNAKPVRSSIDIHDLVMNYESNSLYLKMTDVWYGADQYFGEGIFSSNPAFFPTFSRWLDPFGFTATQFEDVHAVGVGAWLTIIPGSDDHQFDSFQFPYETVPFFQPDNDLPPFGPRSAFLPVPPTQPTLPDYSTWPAALLPGEYPRESNWTLANRRTRYLKQHIDASSRPTAMLGFNFSGADDPVVNQFVQIRLQQLTVAFWGPDFMPSDLLPLDPNGTSPTSGVLLVEDGVPDPTAPPSDPPVYIAQNGVFGPSLGPVSAGGEYNFDTPVRVSGLQWRSVPELLDLDGDGVADDMNGDGTVNDADKAWVLQFRPATPWRLPVIDDFGGNFPIVTLPAKSAEDEEDADVIEHVKISRDEAELPDPKQAKANPSRKTVKTMTEADTFEAETNARNTRSDAKAFGPAGNPGDDLFIVVRTSDSITRFEQFRCVVPSTLPERPASQRAAGIQLVPQTPISVAVYDKLHPEETPVAPYYGPKPFGYDLIEANVSAKIVDFTGTGQTIIADSGDVAVLGLDLSTNRGNSVGTAASGQTGTGSAGAFTVTGEGWQANAFTDYFLIDSRYRAFRITGNTSTKLNLEGGTPNNGPWRIVRDPTFLEQLIVEFYDVGRDGGFNIVDDLLPLENSANSGVKIYRDNDNAPGNQNGVFDETDILVELDYPPFLIGQAGEPDTQVMFIFSTPGTDNIPQNIANQPTRRQWVPDTFLAEGGDNAAVGSDFFVVIQTSETLDIGDDFRVGIVSWGPNTPTEPDPDTFPPPPATRVGEFDVFSEFPWGARAIGLITFFKSNDLPQYDKYKYYKQYPELDNSGFNWVRSTVNKAAQTRTILASEVVVSPTDVVITSVTPTQLPKNVPSGGITLAIAGQNFGASPTADIDGVALIIVSSTNTSIIVTIPGNTVLDQDGDLKVTLRVTNTQTGRNGKFSNFTIITGGTGEQPTITSINPTQGTRNDFPVTITGTNFDDPVVRFEGTVMPIQGTPTSTTIVVAFPTGGLPQTGPLDVTVQNQTSGLLAVKPDGFTYINSPTGGGGGGFGGGGGLPTCFIATAAYGTPFEGRLATFRGFRDDVLLKTALGAALVDAYYTLSPPMADAVAQSPVLAGAARILLTPVAWMIEFPVCAGIGAALLLTFLAIRVTRARPVRQRVMAGAPRDIK